VGNPPLLCEKIILLKGDTIMAKPVVDVDLCEGCASCEEICPEVFKVGDDGKVQVIGPDKCDTCNCQEAADICPTQAITIE
jgi:ferredoxin